MRIVCIPIDSRPCNTQFLERLVTWAGSGIVLPRPEETDFFRRPADHAQTRDFLARELPACDAAVISLDSWCYGSLLASREEDVSPEEALRRTDELRQVLSACPDVPVYMSSVILRSSISTFGMGDLEAYNAMTEYSVYADRFERFGEEADRQKRDSALSRVPSGLADKVLRVRERNVRVNLAAVDMAADGYVKSLCILQEDSQIYGLPRRDQRQVEARLRQKGPAGVFVRNGTDEAGALLAAQALWEGRPPFKAHILYLGDEGFIAPFEDRPFRENMESACRQIGIEPDHASGTVIAVCCPEKGGQGDAYQGADKAHLGLLAAEADRLIEGGKRVYLLDVVRANGGCRDLIGQMRHADGLWGYSAWNTASNSMGTLLSQVLTDEINGHPNRQYYKERLLDDLVYQGTVRQQLHKELLAAGEDPYFIRDTARAQSMLEAFFALSLPELWPLRELPEYRVKLCWNRIFEIEVKVI